MKLIPGSISSLTQSDAERKVFRLMEGVELGDGAVAMHSLNLPSHVYKRMGEIDFVVLAPAGLLVCEVKGGRISRSEEDGIWEFTDRNDHVARRPEGPFAQARSAMFSLEKELATRLEPDVLGRISFGYCVVFPDQPWDLDSVDEPRRLALSSKDCASSELLQTGLRSLLKDWATTNARAPLAAADLRAVRNALRPSFDVAPSLRARAADALERVEGLTREQYVGLDWAQAHPRLLVAGGAGTGKTLLAAEIARRDRKRGQVLLTCHSPILAAHLASRPGLDGIDILPVHEAVARVAIRGPWDVVVIDEGQDIFSTEGLEVLDTLARGGIDAGCWRCFYDLNNQAGLFGEVDDAAVEYLKAAGAHPVELSRNCRNSRSVVVYTRTVTGADLGSPLAGEGPQVRARFPGSRDEELQLLTQELARLANQDVLAGSITILSTTSRNESVVSMLPEALGRTIATVDSAVAARWPIDQMSFSLIDDFKGMENDFVLVVDLAHLDDERADLARLYVALSRPRYDLWIAIPDRLRGHYMKLCEQHLPAVTAVAEGIE